MPSRYNHDDRPVRDAKITVRRMGAISGEVRGDGENIFMPSGSRTMKLKLRGVVRLPAFFERGNAIGNGKLGQARDAVDVQLAHDAFAMRLGGAHADARCTAISLLLLPSAMRASTSRSRSLSLATGFVIVSVGDVLIQRRSGRRAC